MGVTVRLESALDLVKKKKNGACEGETLDRTTRPKHPEEIPKTFKVGLYQFIFHQICRRKPYLLNVGSRQGKKRYF